MANEALRVPIQLKDCRFVRSSRIEEFALFLLKTEAHSYNPDRGFGCRTPLFAVEYSEDPIRDIRNHIEDQFERYLGLSVKVEVTDRVDTPGKSFKCDVTGLVPGGERFFLTWEF